MKSLTIEDVQAAYDAMMKAPPIEPVHCVSPVNYKRAVDAEKAGESRRVVYLVAMGASLDIAREMTGEK